jgi:RNA-binding protein
MLTSKQRAYLRGRANDYDTIFQVGKGGINENMLEQIDNALEARELIKLRTLENSDFFAREAAEAIAEELGADVVSVVGSRFVIYRESKKNKKFDLEKLCEIVEEKKHVKKIVKPGYKAKAKSDKKAADKKYAFDKPKTFKKR